MHIYSGTPICKGIAIGYVRILKKEKRQITCRKIEDVKQELGNVKEAVEKSRQEFEKLYNHAVSEMGETEAALFKVYGMLVEDKGFLNAVYDRIRTEKENAEYAVWKTAEKIVERFEKLPDERMRARAADIQNVTECLVRNLAKCETEDSFFCGQMNEREKSPFILFAENVTPEDLMQINRTYLLAVVTSHGSLHSHTAVLARMFQFPAVTGIFPKDNQVFDGMKIIVDGYTGQVIFDPAPEQCANAREKMRNVQKKGELYRHLKGKENITLDGRRIEICANIGDLNSLNDVMENDASGIGLFGSEFLCLEKGKIPTEEEQFTVYKQVLHFMKNKKVVIRTFDIGADKQMAFPCHKREENPALGLRGIRFCLAYPEIFKAQLRALLRAAIYGDLSILYPMITSAEEVCRIRRIIAEIKQELEKEGISYRIPKQGIMIETPAAVMISDELAEMVDFFSIGTNDLIQYTLAADRQNEGLQEIYHSHHKAIGKMLKIVVDNAHKAGIPVGICGGLGADVSMLETFLDLGIDEISVEPSMILKLREIIRKM